MVEHYNDSDGANRSEPGGDAAGEQAAHVRYSRRVFLMRGLTIVAGAALVACGQEQNVAYEPQAAWSDYRPPRILPSPVPPVAPTPFPTPQPGEIGLAGFLALSSVLTGFDDLSPTLGSVYLQSLQSDQQTPGALAELYRQAGFDSATPPRSIDDLSKINIFENNELSGVADTIIEYWYSGTYKTGEDSTVATYVDALAWQAVAYTKPRSICGPRPGFWEEQPPTFP